ncbi:MAG: hypothetical protein LC644_02230, partial [Pseudonocardia sp.]|nr:hypothetical protein [Pseudonocardia sp.]
MSVPFQPSLFGFGDPMADTSFGTLHRFQLDSESWVDLAPGWLRRGGQPVHHAGRIGALATA